MRKTILRTLAVIAVTGLVTVGLYLWLNNANAFTPSFGGRINPGGEILTERANLAQYDILTENGSIEAGAAEKHQNGRGLRGEGGEGRHEASIFGIAEVLKNLAILALIMATVQLVQKALKRFGPRRRANTVT